MAASVSAAMVACCFGVTALVAQSAPPRIPARSCQDTIAGTPAVRLAAPLRFSGEAVSWRTWPVHLGPSRVPVKIIVARVDPSRVSLSLEIERRGDAIGAWTIERAPANALIAFNAGQFTDDGPWGWVVHRGREWQAPGTGALAAAIVVDSMRAVHIIPADSIAAWRGRSARNPALAEAIQSYPLLLQNGRLPAALCRTGNIDRDHRDIRLGVGVRANGEVIVALTRYAPKAMPSAVAARLPIGPTTLEMAEIMLELGSVDALLLDGGLSAQLLVGTGPSRRRWPGLRSVPLAIVGRPRIAN
jgi:hypothetical protein